jgi:hypothetical protein
VQNSAATLGAGANDAAAKAAKTNHLRIADLRGSWRYAKDCTDRAAAR